MCAAWPNNVNDYNKNNHNSTSHMGMLLINVNGAVSAVCSGMMKLM